jgi:CPA1 family monovalent cation:H+ antiporter
MITPALQTRQQPTSPPYLAVALVLGGLLLGMLHPFAAPHLTKDLLYDLFLPGLLFEAAFHLEFAEFWRNRIAIGAFALPGVVAGAALVALLLAPGAHALHLLPGFGWPQALVFGALISATDPIAVISLFRAVGAPPRLTMLMDSESLFNDGTSIVLFTLSLAWVAGTLGGPAQAAAQFFAMVGIGAAIGGAIGMIASLLMRRTDSAVIAIALTIIAAYGSFACAQKLDYSGVLATVTAGMLCGNVGCADGTSQTHCIAIDRFWQYVAFALNSIVFLLIGLSIHLPTLLSDWLPVLLAYLAVNLSRALVILGSQVLLARTRERFPRSWTAALTWGGLRGALPMVLALSLPQQFPERELIISMTFGVAVLTIVLQGATLSLLLRHLRLQRQPEPDGAATTREI